MDALFQHPCLARSGYGEWLTRTVRESMTAIDATIARDDSPRWIITLAETSFDYEAHTTLTVSDTSEISILGDAHDGPLCCNLIDIQTKRLMKILADCSPSIVFDHDTNVLDGVLAVAAVINVTDSWCAFSEFNVLDPSPASKNCGPMIGQFIRSLHRDLWSAPGGP